MARAAKPAGLVGAVAAATAWPTEGTALALAELCRRLAGELDASGESPTAALFKELRTTLEALEAMRDSDDAGADLAVVLSTPVRDAAQPGAGDAGTPRRKNRGATR